MWEEEESRGRTRLRWARPRPMSLSLGAELEKLSVLSQFIDTVLLHCAVILLQQEKNLKWVHWNQFWGCAGSALLIECLKAAGSGEILLNLPRGGCRSLVGGALHVCAASWMCRGVFFTVCQDGVSVWVRGLSAVCPWHKQDGQVAGLFLVLAVGWCRSAGSCAVALTYSCWN